MKAKNIIMISIILVFLIVLGMLYIFVDKNDYVFKINGEKVTISEFNIYLDIQKKIMQGNSEKEIVWSDLQDGVPLIDIAKENAKDYVTDFKIKNKEADRKKVTLSALEKQIIKQKISLMTDTKEKFNLTDEELINLNENAILSEKLSIALYKETDHTAHEHGTIDIESYENGETLAEETYDPRHILFSTQNKTEDEKKEIRTKAEQVLERVKAGEDFATLAKEYSEDGGSKENGGLYTGITKNQFIPEFEKAALSLKVGEVYPELVEGAYGFHIIKLEGHKEGGLSNEQAKAIIDSEFNAKIKELTDNAKIELGKYYEIGLK